MANGLTIRLLVLQQSNQSLQGALKCLMEPVAFGFYPVVIAARKQVTFIDRRRLLQSLPSLGARSSQGIGDITESLICSIDGTLKDVDVKLERCFGAPLNRVPIDPQKTLSVR
jgi:hypothetical protein